MNIGHALKVCRSAKKLSLGDLAGLTELSTSYLSMIESGKREPTLSSIENAAGSDFADASNRSSSKLKY